MPQGYGFLKYGRPMTAAAPLLLGLSVMPSPAHACTGSANDPVFCSQVDGQFVTGIGAFIGDNLTGVPGSSPIPGSTAALDDDNDFDDLISPIDDDNDIDSSFYGEDAFTDDGFVATPLVFAPVWAQGVNESFPQVTNSTAAAGSPAITIPISGFPQLPGAGAPAPVVGQQTQFYTVPLAGPNPGQFTITVNSTDGTFTVDAPDGNVPAEIQTLVDQSQGTDNQESGCSISAADCQAGLGRYFVDVVSTNVMPPESVAPVLNALVNGTPSSAPLSSGEALVNGPDASPADSSGLRTHYQTDGQSTAPSTVSTSSGASSDDAAGDAYVKRQVASITKLREEAANAPDPETRRQKQAELQRKESGVRLYGSAALRNALGLGDASSAPVPGRN